jgi:hypothetical protein
MVSSPPASTTPAVGASPFVYRNSGNAFAVDVMVYGGTFSNVEWSPDGTSYYSVAASQSQGKWHVEPGEYIRVTYSVLPILRVVPLRC